MNNKKICRWYHMCPLKRFYEEGKIDKKWIKDYCFNAGKECKRLEMEEKEIPHPDNMMPDGKIKAGLR